MLFLLPDEEIDALIREPKTTPKTLFPLRLIEHNKHRRRDYEVKSASASGNEFVIAIRQSTIDGLNFGDSNAQENGIQHAFSFAPL